MKDLEKKFLEVFEQESIENNILPVVNFMELDEIAEQEFVNLVKNEGLSNEVFVNTLKLVLEEDDLQEYMKLHLEAHDIKVEANKELERVGNHMESLVKGQQEFLEEKSTKIIEGFFEHYGDRISRMITDSVERTQK